MSNEFKVVIAQPEVLERLAKIEGLLLEVLQRGAVLDKPLDGQLSIDDIELPVAVSQPQPVKTAPEASVTIEMLRSKLAKLSQSGKTAEVKSLLGKFGASKLSEVDPADYELLWEAIE